MTYKHNVEDQFSKKNFSLPKFTYVINCNLYIFMLTGVNLKVPATGVTYTGTGDICPAGFECPSNSAFYSPCDPGKYSPGEGYDSCLDCPQGHYCVNATVTPVICPAGYYCPVGTTAANEFPCPAGTYNNVTGM